MSISPKIQLARILLLSCASPAFSHAAEEFEDSVPIEIVRQFIINIPSSGDTGLYQDVMDGFPDFSLPDNAEVLASLDQGYLQRVLLQTSGDLNASVTALRDQFIDQGWVVNPPSPVMFQGGFITPNTAKRPESLCHPEHGNLQLSAGGDMINMILSGQTAGVEPVDCNRNNARSRPGMAQHMPNLEVPAQEGIPLGMPTGGFSSSGGREAEARSTIQDERSIEALFTSFREQLEDQDWTTETQNIGAVTATGTWLKSEDNMELIGVLTIISLSDDNYDLRFRMVRQGASTQRGDAIRAFTP